MLPKISVIIPVYNASHSLQTCVTSLLAQTYTDLEFIFVDDGSKDDSLLMLNDMQKDDSRIKIITQKNKGPSAARNIGIKESNGKWILFCDSDDTVCENWAKTLLNVAENNKDKLVCCGINIYNEKECLLIKHFVEGDECSYYELFRNNLSGQIYNKIFRSDIIRKNNILFDETRKRGEDVLFVLEYLKWARTIVNIPQCLYNYYRYDSITTLTNTYRNDNFELINDLYKERLNYINEINMNEFKKCYWHFFWDELEKNMILNQRDPYYKKIKINKKILHLDTFRELLLTYGGAEMDKFSFFCLKRGYFLPYWIWQKCHKIKIKYFHIRKGTV